MISAISTDSSEVVSTSVPMSIPLMIRHSHFIHHTRFFRNCKLGVGFIRRG